MVQVNRIHFVFFYLFMFLSPFLLSAREGREDPAMLILKSYRCFEKQVINENTIYVIRYDFNLHGKTISLPKGSELLFDGGSVYNGLLVGDKFMNEDFYIGC